jgi:hypothetical protein
MLSTNHSLKRLNILKRSAKVQPLGGNVSLDDLAFLVKRLTVQVDDLVEEKKILSPTTTPIEQLPLPPAPIPQSNLPITRQNSIIPPQQEQQQITKKIINHTTIDPWASYVPKNYGALLQRLEDIESLQKCPNDCCASTGTVSSADGVPWPQPIEPFNNNKSSSADTLDIQYTHWCTLMRCLPLMDPITSAHVKTVGLYAMREILKSKAATQKRGGDHHEVAATSHCCAASTATAPTTTRLRDSMSYLNIPDRLQSLVVQNADMTSVTAGVPVAATQDMPSWMSTSETKTALDSEAEAPIPLPKEDTATTPTPSGFPSPTYQLHTAKRFQKWVQYKKSKLKTNTDTAATPHSLGQSQTLRKIGSWFF